MKGLDFFDCDIIFKNSKIGIDGFQYIESEASLKHDKSSFILSSFQIIHYYPIRKFPNSFYTQVEKLKELCFSEERLCIKIPLTKYEILKFNLLETELTLFEYYMLYLEHGEMPLVKNLNEDKFDLSKEINNLLKIRALERFFINVGRVYYSNLIEKITKPGLLKKVTAHSYKKQYELLVYDNILEKGKEEDLPLILSYKTKSELINICSHLNYLNKLPNSKKEIINDVLINDPEIIKTKIWEKFYLLSDDFQNLKMWLQKENVYKKVFAMLNDKFEFIGTLLNSVISELVYRNKDYEAALHLIEVYLINKHTVRNDSFTLNKLLKQKKYIINKISNG